MLATIEQIWLAEFLRRSVIAYPIVNALHVLSLGMLVTSALFMDARLLGLGRRLALSDVIATVRPVAVGAMIVAVATGLMLFSVRPQAYAENPVFWVKLGVLALAIVNAVAFTLLRRHLEPDAGLTKVMAGLSILLWLAVLIAGRSIAFFD